MLYDEFPGQASSTYNAHAYTGMLLNNFNDVIGIKGYRLQFSNMNNGIIAHDCNISVLYSKFEDIDCYETPPQFKQFNGSGIFSHGNGNGLYSLSQ